MQHVQCASTRTAGVAGICTSVSAITSTSTFSTRRHGHRHHRWDGTFARHHGLEKVQRLVGAHEGRPAGGEGRLISYILTTQRRKHAALVCRLGEKRLLHRVRAELDDALAQKPKPIDQRVGTPSTQQGVA